MATKRRNAEEDVLIVAQMTPGTRRVRLFPVDHPCGRVVVRLLDVTTGEGVEPEDGGPTYFDTVRDALAACERASIVVVGAQDSDAGYVPAGFSAVNPRKRPGLEARPNPSPANIPRPPSYKEAHWGIDAKKLSDAKVPNPRDNREMIALGRLIKASYLTTKGGDGGELVEYVHAFERTTPILAYGDHDGRLYIVGGSYRVTRRGIVG